MIELLYLQGLEKIFNAAMPETEPKIVKLRSFGTKGLEIRMLGETSLTALVDREGWGLLVEENSLQVSPLGHLDTDPGEIAFLIAARVVRPFVSYLYPEPGTIDIQAIAEGLGEGTRNYRLFMNMLRYFMMLKDGVISEDNIPLQQRAHEMIDWLGNRGSFSD